MHRQGNRITVVYFWATWCKPCLPKLLELAQLQEQYRDQGVEIVLIHLGKTDPDRILEVLQAGGAEELTCLLDRRGASWTRWGFHSIPETCFLDGDGKMTQRAWDGDVAGRLRRLLRETSSPPQ